MNSFNSLTNKNILTWLSWLKLYLNHLIKYILLNECINLIKLYSYFFYVLDVLQLLEFIEIF